MCSTFKEAIENFLRNPLSRKKLDQLLWDEIIKAIVKKKSSVFKIEKHNYFQKFKFLYKDNKDLLPIEVQWNEVKKDFSDAIQILYEHLIKKISKRDANTIKSLLGDQIERKKWIIATLGMVLNNKVFNKEIQGKVILTSPLILQKHNNEVDFEKNLSDEVSYKNFVAEQYTETIEFITFQKEAFFWCPGELFQNKELDCNYSIYIAFFFSWLRLYSNATYTEIAKEIRVGVSAVSRDWKPHPELEKYFPAKRDIDIIYPIYFSNAALKRLGIHDRKIRCFQKDCDSHDYKHLIYPKKMLLWDLYDILRFINLNEDYFKANYDKKLEDIIGKEKLNFLYEIKINTELNINLKKRFSLLYIKDIS